MAELIAANRDVLLRSLTTPSQGFGIVERELHVHGSIREDPIVEEHARRAG